MVAVLLKPMKHIYLTTIKLEMWSVLMEYTHRVTARSVLKSPRTHIRPWARYDPRAPPHHILANLYFFESLGCPEYESGL